MLDTNLASAALHRGPGQELAEEIDLPLQLLPRHGLDEGLGGCGGGGIELGDLPRRGARHLQRRTLAGQLAHQAEGVGAGGVEAAAGEQEIPHHGVAHVPLQARDAAETGHQAEPQLGKAEARQPVGHHEIASEGELQAATEADAVHCGEGRVGPGIDGVEHGVDALQKTAHAGHPGRRRGDLLHAGVQLAEIGTGAEARRQAAVDDEGVGVIAQRLQGGDAALQLAERRGSDLVARRPVQFQLDDAVHELPAQRLSVEFPHACLRLVLGKPASLGVAAAARAGEAPYMASITAAKRSRTRWRLILPFAVRNPLSGVKGSRWMW